MPNLTAVEAERRAAFERVVPQVYAPLQRYLHRRTDPSTADDVLGDVLLVLWRRVDDLPPDVLPWAYGVARRCLANAVRATTRQERLVRRLADVRPAATAEDPELEQALRALPAADQELLRLWAWEQLPPREIALVLEISPNAASIRLHRATKKLRAAMVTRKDAAAPGHLPGRERREVQR